MKAEPMAPPATMRKIASGKRLAMSKAVASSVVTPSYWRTTISRARPSTRLSSANAATSPAARNTRPRPLSADIGVDEWLFLSANRSRSLKMKPSFHRLESDIIT
jgi:hypothetical protein